MISYLETRTSLDSCVFYAVQEGLINLFRAVTKIQSMSTLKQLKKLDNL